MHLARWSAVVLAALAVNVAATPLDPNVVSLNATAPFTDPADGLEKRTKSKNGRKTTTNRKEKTTTKCKRMNPNDDPACRPQGHNIGTGGGSASDNLGDTGSETQIDCSYQDHHEACNTMCYSALCSPPGVATGIIIREKGEGEEVGFRSSHPLELGNGATLVGSNYIDNRKLSGCKSKTTARNGFQKAHLQQSGPSPDEWPPASSTSGGIYPDGYGVVVQMISTHSNTHTGSFFSHGNLNGYIRLVGVTQQADVCYNMKMRQFSLAQLHDRYCGKDTRFGQYIPKGLGHHNEGTYKLAFS